MKLGLKRMTGDGLWGNVPLILQAGKEFAMKIPEIEVLIFKKNDVALGRISYDQNVLG